MSVINKNFKISKMYIQINKNKSIQLISILGKYCV